MKKQNLKLTLSIIACIIVGALIATGIILSLLSYSYSWNNRVDLIYVPQEAKLLFEGTAGDSQFVAQAENGAFDNGFWEIPTKDTTFTQNNNKVTISLKFTNKCTSRLKVSISGIHFDSKKRFDTTLTKNNIEQQISENNTDKTGEYTFYLEYFEDTVTIDLNYTLTEQTVRISGDTTDRQILAIRIDNAEQ